MKTMIDPKSVLLGAMAALVLGCGLGAGEFDDLDRRADPAVSRFQINSNEQHVFVLDTATGRVWEKYLPPNQGSTSSNFKEQKLDDTPS